MKRILSIFIGLILMAVVIPFTPAMPPEKYVTIPSEVPEALWGHRVAPLTGEGVVSDSAQTGSDLITGLTGWSRDEYLDVNEPSITWKWLKDNQILFEYKLLPGKCVKIGKLSVEFTMERQMSYWKYNISKCSWW